MKVTVDVNSCKDCPFLKTGYTYGNDGRDGSLVYICKLGAFGGIDSTPGYEGYARGLFKLPDGIHKNCKL